MSEEHKILRLQAEKKFRFIDPIKYMSRPKLFDVSHFRSREELEAVESKSEPVKDTLSGQYHTKRIDHLQGLFMHLQNKLNEHTSKKRRDKL